MRILTLNGSPRTNSNSMALAEAVLAELPGGATCVAVPGNILACSACGLCAAGAACPLDSHDAMPDLRAGLHDSDRLLVVSPLHFSSLAAPLVTAFSRLQPEWRSRPRPAMNAQTPQKKGALVVTGGSLYPNMFEAARIVTAAVFRTLGYAFSGMATASDTDALPVTDNLPALERARQIGVELAREA